MDTRSSASGYATRRSWSTCTTRGATSPLGERGNAEPGACVPGRVSLMAPKRLLPVPLVYRRSEAGFPSHLQRRPRLLSLSAACRNQERPPSIVALGVVQVRGHGPAPRRHGKSAACLAPAGRDCMTEGACHGSSAGGDASPNLHETVKDRSVGSAPLVQDWSLVARRPGRKRRRPHHLWAGKE